MPFQIILKNKNGIGILLLIVAKQKVNKAKFCIESFCETKKNGNFFTKQCRTTVNEKNFSLEKHSVANPDHFSPDPDPTFLL
jgi:hypothetical protein